MKRYLQSAAATAQQSQRSSDVTPALGQFLAAPVKLLTEREAAERCRWFDRGCTDPVAAFQKWARRAGVPVKRAGRARLYDPRVLDAFLEREPWTRRHANTVATSTDQRKPLSFGVKAVGSGR
jgi:hypothetical protein